MTTNTQMFAKDFESLAKTQAQVAFQIGARAIIMAGDTQGQSGWKTRLRESHPELRQFPNNELMLMIQASEVFSEKDKALNLPWCIYVYALHNTDNPSEWVQTAAKNGWSSSEFHHARLVARPDTPGCDDQTLTAIHADTITGPHGRLVGSLYVYDDLTQPGARIQANMDIPKGPLTLGDLAAVRAALDECITQILIYCSTAGISGEPGASADCAK